MVSPELPESLEDDIYSVNVEHHLADPVNDSDDIDANSEEGYNGYQLLSTDDSIVIDHNLLQISSQFTQSSSDQPDEYRELRIDKLEHSLQNSADADQSNLEDKIVLEVWNKPRPQELDIDLDSTKTNQILSAMANFRPANLRMPEWAENVSEEHWKEELLQRIRHQKTSNQN